jgi:hypothetical protein
MCHTRRRYKVRAMRLAIAASIVMAAAVLTAAEVFHFSYVKSQRESPWDHSLSNVRKLFHVSCLTEPPQAHRLCRVPPLFILSGRLLIHSETPRSSWAEMKPETWNATAAVLPSAGCQHTTWANHLFEIYSEMFQDVLKRFPTQQEFIFIEDDAFLVDKERFRREACWWSLIHIGRGQQKSLFYSFFNPEPNHSNRWSRCFYQWGTQAFLANRQLMRSVIRAPAQSRCRLPIDMFIASIGPWYASQHKIVEHGTLKSLRG